MEAEFLFNYFFLSLRARIIAYILSRGKSQLTKRAIATPMPVSIILFTE